MHQGLSSSVARSDIRSGGVSQASVLRVAFESPSARTPLHVHLVAPMCKSMKCLRTSPCGRHRAKASCRSVHLSVCLRVNPQQGTMVKLCRARLPSSWVQVGSDARRCRFERHASRVCRTGADFGCAVIKIGRHSLRSTHDNKLTRVASAHARDGHVEVYIPGWEGRAIFD